MLCVGGIVIVLVKAAMAVILASVACTRRPIPALTGKRNIVLAFRKAFPTVLAVPVVRAFPHKGTLVLQFPMKLDLFAHGGVVFPNCSRYSCLGRAVSNTGFNDPPFLGREMRYILIGIHEKPSFPEGIVRDPNYTDVKDLFPCP